ncbi:MAG TPA: TSUP family transporter [Gemmatimonadales bacterium]|nr:TSUP family transporter [Gemmatimonadales bacterium]
MTSALVVVVGLVGGVVSGLFGIGGAIVIVPALVLLLKVSQHTANGTSLAALLLPVGLLGVLEYYRRGEVVVSYALLLAVGIFVGSLLGAKFAGSISDLVLRRAFGGLLLVVAGRLLLGR